MKWILQTGLGANELLFEPMLDLLPDYQYVPHPVPEADETIEAYARRVADQIEGDGPRVLCGISFGGMLSSILCAHLRPEAVVLMSSTSKPFAVAGGARTFEWMSRVLPDTMAAWLRKVGRGAATWVEPMSREQTRAFETMMRRAPLELIRRGGRMIMEWSEDPVIECPRFHLHGARDTLIPLSKVEATRVVAEAGHLLNLTHPEPVRDFIQDIRQKLEN